ncbi:MAG: PAS domain S-box protein [Pseudomonadota bacterium]
MSTGGQAASELDVAVLQRDMELVAELATAWLKPTSEDEVYTRLAGALQQIIGADAIINVSSYEPTAHTYLPRALVGLGSILDKLVALLGKHPRELRGAYPDSVLQAMASGHLTRLAGGAVELAGGTIPPVLLRRLVALAGLHDVFVVGFTRGSAAGGISIITRRPDMALRSATIETLARLAAVTLERERSRSERDQLDRRLRALYQNSPVAIGFSRNGTNVGANPAYVHLCGYEDEKQIIGTSLLDQIAPSAREDIQHKIRARAAGELVPSSSETVGLRRDGKEIPIWIQVAAIEQDDGPLTLAFVTDITERKQAEEDLRRSEARLSAVLDETPFPIALVDIEDNEIHYWSRTALELFGHTAPTAAEWYRIAYPDPEYRAAVLQRWKPALKEAQITGRPVNTGEYRVTCRDGSERVCELHAAFIENTLVVTFHDITERKQLQAQVTQADRLASMGTLAAGVAHEINNPLSYVLFNIESLTQDLPRLTDAARRCGVALREQVGDAAYTQVLGDAAELMQPAGLDDVLDRMREALSGSHRIKEIVKGLGTFSRVEQVQLSRIDVKYAVESAASMAFNEIKFRARLVKDYGPVPAVWASEGKLAQVFLNLLINAAHSIDEGDVDGNQIMVRTWTEGELACVSVADTGKGIEPEKLPRIFDPFFSTKDPGKGTGLGLAICRNIVTEFGGRIEVESQLGKGSRFIVRLPVKSTAGEAKPVETAAETGLDVGVLGRILVVDDEPAICSALRRLLGAHHEVVTAGSGLEARAVLQQDQGFDLVLCDLMMPEMTGMDLHAWLVAHHPDIARHMVFITGGAFTPRAAEYLAAAGNLKVEKPFDAANLRKLVATLVQAARSRRQP